MLELIKACMKWEAEETERYIKYESGKYERGDRIWVYNYNLQYGQYVYSVDELPTTEQMMRAGRAELLERAKMLESERSVVLAEIKAMECEK